MAIPRRITGMILAGAMALAIGRPASAGIISLQDLIAAGPWTLQNLNFDGTSDGAATGASFTADGTGSIGVTGSDANTFDFTTGAIVGPMVDDTGTPIGTLTQYTTVITDGTPGLTPGADGVSLSGDLTFNWLFTTLDLGSLNDPAGYFLCPASIGGFPGGQCGLFQLTTDLDAINQESGQITLALSPGDVFGLFVSTPDNVGGAGTILFSADTSTALAPEPASLFLIGGGLLAIGAARRKARLQ
jgi:hypothetical protein